MPSLFFWAVPVSEAPSGPLGGLYVLSHLILSRFPGVLLDLGRRSVSVAPSKYWRRSLDKQGLARLCTGGPSSLWMRSDF